MGQQRSRHGFSDFNKYFQDEILPVPYKIRSFDDYMNGYIVLEDPFTKLEVRIKYMNAFIILAVKLHNYSSYEVAQYLDANENDFVLNK